jgi:hypothetical protein
VRADGAVAGDIFEYANGGLIFDGLSSMQLRTNKKRKKRQHTAGVFPQLILRLRRL